MPFTRWRSAAAPHAENEADVQEWTAAFDQAQRHFQTRGAAATRSAATTTTAAATVDGAGAVAAAATTTAAEGSLRPAEAPDTAQSGAEGEVSEYAHRKM